MEPAMPMDTHTKQSIVWRVPSWTLTPNHCPFPCTFDLNTMWHCAHCQCHTDDSNLLSKDYNLIIFVLLYLIDSLNLLDHFDFALVGIIAEMPKPLQPNYQLTLQPNAFSFTNGGRLVCHCSCPSCYLSLLSNAPWKPVYKPFFFSYIVQKYTYVHLCVQVSVCMYLYFNYVT